MHYFKENIMRKHKHKHKTFFELSGTQRRTQYIHIKNLIGKHPERLFYTPHVMENDDYEPDENFPEFNQQKQKSCWCDLYFLSKKYRFYYNACFITRDMAAIDAIDDYINEEADKRNKFNSPTLGEWFLTTPSSKGLSLLKRNPNYDNYFEEYDRLQEEIKEEVFNSKVVTIQTDTCFDFKYCSGVGLHATLDTDDLTIDVMNEWIENFWKNGETISKGKSISYSGDDIRKLYTSEYFKRQG